MFAEDYKQAFVLLLLSFSVGVTGNHTTIITSATTTLIISDQSTTLLTTTIGQIQPNGTITSTHTFARSKSVVGSQKSVTTVGMEVNGDNKLKPYVIIVIIASAAVVLIASVLLLILCIYRRQRRRSLERERQLSYSNKNYESTVTFRADMDTDGTTLGSDQGAASPRKTNNNPRRDAGYEIVDLPGEKKQAKRQYENVTPQHDTNATARPNQPYENVPPMVCSANDKAKSPDSQYEEVFLDSPKKKNDKYYENVELNN